jgi:hypothetical protein
MINSNNGEDDPYKGLVKLVSRQNTVIRIASYFHQLNNCDHIWGFLYRIIMELYIVEVGRIFNPRANRFSAGLIISCVRKEARGGP